MSHPAYIFDADGVINSLAVHEADPRVITQIAQLLNEGNYVAINTGRGYPWIKDEVVNNLLAHIAIEKLDRLFVSAEMGGVSVEFSWGTEHDSRSAFSLPPEHIGLVKKVYDDNAGSNNIAWYEGKVSMATIFKPPQASVSAFEADAKKIVETLQSLLADEHIKINVNADAIDVTTPEAGKWAGAQLVYDWLQRTPGAETGHYICFGDNTSDYEMARFFGRQRHRVDFIFTGKTLGNIEHDEQVTFIHAKAPYSDGTYEYLQTILQPHS